MSLRSTSGSVSASDGLRSVQQELLSTKEMELKRKADDKRKITDEINNIISSKAHSVKSLAFCTVLMLARANGAEKPKVWFYFIVWT